MEISGIHIIFNLWCWSLSQSAFVATKEKQTCKVCNDLKGMIFP